MNLSVGSNLTKLAQDGLAGVIVFLVALPLCLGIAVGSGADPLAGLIAGVIGGVVVGWASGSHTSVSGPAAGLTAIVAAQIVGLGSFEAFLLAVTLAGVIQFALGLVRAGSLSAFFPSSVIKGLLAAIGIILILGQLPLLLGHRKASREDTSVVQSDSLEAVALGAKADADPQAIATRSEPVPRGDSGLPNPLETANSGPLVSSRTNASSHAMVPDAASPHAGSDHEAIGQHLLRFTADMNAIFRDPSQRPWAAMAIGLLSLAVLTLWDHIPLLKKSIIPAPLVVVIVGSTLAGMLRIGGGMEATHFVFVPTFETWTQSWGMLRTPDFTQWLRPEIYVAAVTLSVVASLETLLNLEAVDKLDPRRRVSPPNRELLAQGLGNILCGLIGGLPVTSVVIRGSVNVNAGAVSKRATMVHGALLLVCVLTIPWLLNLIPLSCLAAILVMTGYKLATPRLFRSMWAGGPYHFFPFVITLTAIVLADLLVGVIIGLTLSLLFILASNIRRPIKRLHERHIDGDLIHIELANQVSFLNRASLERVLRQTPAGSRLLLDARRTDYIDPDVLALIKEYCQEIAPVHDIQVRLVGLRDTYRFQPQEQSIDYSVIERRDLLTPAQVLQALALGNERFVAKRSIDHDLRPTTQDLTHPHRPIAAIYTGIDPKTPVEMLFDLGVGDAYALRIPGVIYGPKAAAGLEYAVEVSGIKVILVIGRADGELLRLAMAAATEELEPTTFTRSAELEAILSELKEAFDPLQLHQYPTISPEDRSKVLLQAAWNNVRRTARRLLENHPILAAAQSEGKLLIESALLDMQTGRVTFDSDQVKT